MRMTAFRRRVLDLIADRPGITLAELRDAVADDTAKDDARRYLGPALEFLIGLGVVEGVHAFSVTDAERDRRTRRRQLSESRTIGGRNLIDIMRARGRRSERIYTGTSVLDSDENEWE